MPPLRELTVETILEFISTSVRESGAKGVIVGVSGGIDSAVVSTLCVRALGPEKVMNIFMPTESTPEEDLEDVKALCKWLGTKLEVVDISPILSQISSALPNATDRCLLGNAKARVRMIVLYHYARLNRFVVMGTSNKSELLIGYFTKFGDGGADFCPIGDLYKSEVRELAKVLGVPERIRNKIPSAGLWKGQTDEGEIGISYDELDQILIGFELSLSNEEISKRTGIPLDKVERIWSMHRDSVHKRKMPLIPKLGLRTVGLDWRE